MFGHPVERRVDTLMQIVPQRMHGTDQITQDVDSVEMFLFVEQALREVDVVDRRDQVAALFEADAAIA